MIGEEVVLCICIGLNNKNGGVWILTNLFYGQRM
jgi:hypothetical protein